MINHSLLNEMLNVEFHDKKNQAERQKAINEFLNLDFSDKKIEQELQKAIKQCPNLVFVANEDHFTLLHAVAKSGNLALCKEIIQLVNRYKSNFSHDTDSYPLHRRDKSRMMPVDYAKQGHHEEVVEYLSLPHFLTSIHENHIEKLASNAPDREEILCAAQIETDYFDVVLDPVAGYLSQMPIFDLRAIPSKCWAFLNASFSGKKEEAKLTADSESAIPLQNIASVLNDSTEVVLLNASEAATHRFNLAQDQARLTQENAGGISDLYLKAKTFLSKLGVQTAVSVPEFDPNFIKAYKDFQKKAHQINRSAAAGNKEDVELEPSSESFDFDLP